MKKWRERGVTEIPVAFIWGVPPAYEIMANFSGLHMDLWGEMEMVGTVMDMDIEMVKCETIDMLVPAHAEIVAEGLLNIAALFDFGTSVAPSMYYLPKVQKLPEVRITALTMRRDRPIYRNHQTVPDTDHQPLPRLCHEAVLYNRINEMGLTCTTSVSRPGVPRFRASSRSSIRAKDRQRRADAVHGRALAQHQDGGRGQPGHRSRQSGLGLSRDGHARGPVADVIIVPNTRGSPFDPSAVPIEGDYPWRIVGKIGIDATAKPAIGPRISNRAWPRHWGQVQLKDFL